MTTPRQLWNDAKAGCPDAVLILESDGAFYTYGEDAVAVKYAMGNVESPTGEQLNAALEELTSRGTQVVFAQEDDHGSQGTDATTRQTEAESTATATSEEETERVGRPQAREANLPPRLKYAANPWVKEPGERGSTRRWVNRQTGKVIYSDTQPGAREPGREQVAEERQPGQPEQPSMSDPIPLPPGTAKGLGATGAPGLPNFQEPPGPGEPGGAAEWGTTESLASLYGRDNMSPQTAQRFNLSAAKAMGLEIPEGQKEQQAQLAEEFLRHNAHQLAQTMNAAESMGWKPRGKRLVTNAGSAARWLVGQAEATGYERQGGDMASELAGAVEHLQASEGTAEQTSGLTDAILAYAVISRLVGPLVAIPLALAYGYINRGGTSAVAGANTHLDQLSERLGIRSPFVATTRVDPKPEKPIRLRPEDFLDEATGKPKEPKVPRARRVTDKSADAAAQAYIDKALAAGWTPRPIAETPQKPRASTPEAREERRRSETEHRKGLAREENEAYHAAVNQIPFDYRQDFQQHVAAMHADKAANVAQIVNERRELLGHIAGQAGMSAMTRQIQQSGDPDQVKGFDLLVQIVENAPETYGNLMGETFRGDTEGDVEARLYEILKKPNSYYEPPKPSEVADELASEWQRQETAAGERAASTMDAEAEVAAFDPSSPTFGEGPAVDPDEFDPQAEPFAKKYAFKESEHPRESSGKPEGGRFVGGEETATKPVNKQATRPTIALFERTGDQFANIQQALGVTKEMGPAGARSIQVALAEHPSGQVIADLLAVEGDESGYDDNGFASRAESVYRDAVSGRYTRKELDAATAWLEKTFNNSQPLANVNQYRWIRGAVQTADTIDKPDPYAQKFARDLSTGKLPNLSRLEDPEATIAEADRVLAVRPEDGTITPQQGIT